MSHLKDDNYGAILAKHIDFIISHVFLPPKLPQKSDDHVDEKNQTLLTFLRETMQEYIAQHVDIADIAQRQFWCSISKMLDEMVKHHEGHLIANILVFYIRAQNAGLILRQNSSEVLIESFEASPCAQQVMEAQKRLLVYYPGTSIAIPLETFQQRNFQEELSTFISKMNDEELPKAQPQSKKAGSIQTEDRDTIRPIYLSHMLTGILRAIGQPSATPRRIAKRIGDDVLWKSAKLPWRRSPLWLVSRVVLQTSLPFDDAAQTHTAYKSFILLFMAKILEVAVCQAIESDLIRVMQAKIGRRMYKLRDLMISPSLLQAVHKVLEEAGNTLHRRWIKIQEDDTASQTANWDPAVLDYEKDTGLTLHNSKDYLENIIQLYINMDSDAQGLLDDPQAEPSRIGGHHSPADLEAFLTQAVSLQSLHLVLADFEVWVKDQLDRWTTSCESRAGPSACELAKCLKKYTISAGSTYENNPESWSRMLLTTLELWVALDKLTTIEFPMLKDYSPSIPLAVLGRLLLPKRTQMERLCRVEVYIQARYDCQRYGSLFSDNISSASFSVRYAQSSASHHDIRSTIMKMATEERNEKLAEIQNENSKYSRLKEKSRTTPCNYDFRGQHQYRFCTACGYGREADSLRVEVHEWPLPPTDLDALAVMFELDCPETFIAWRDTTYMILVDICSPNLKISVDQPEESLSTYNGLKNHFINRNQRLQWASSVKSFLRSHYREQSCPTTENAICKNHALQYRFYDSSKSAFVSETLDKYDMSEICTFKIPVGPYRNLQYAVVDTLHTSNEVIANQNDCAKELSLHEYYSFGTLRAGHRIQWLNVAREIVARRLTFSKIETYILISQAIWQVGPRGANPRDVHRDSHVLPKFAGYGKDIIKEMANFLTSIEVNWFEGVSARTLIILTVRLLSLTEDPGVIEDAAFFLRRLRACTYRWTKDLVGLNMKNPTNDSKLRALEMAATTRMTYDVDFHFISRLLHDPVDVAVFVECGIIIHDNTPVKVDNLPSETILLLDSDRRLAYQFQPHLISLGNIFFDGLDRGIREVWPAYGGPGSHGPQWEAKSKSSAWVYKRLPQNLSEGKRLTRICFNIREGKLLVNGSPFGRLPLEYTAHPTYAKIFRQDILDTAPSDMQDMTYEMKHRMGASSVGNPGYKVYFSMRGKELIIRMEKDGHLLELVPHSFLVDDFPSSLILEYAHVMDLDTKTIEFRPLKDIWTSSPENWFLRMLKDRPWIMERGTSTNKLLFIDYRSPTMSIISTILKPIELQRHIHIHLTKNTTIDIHLPRYKLQFTVNEQGDIECASLPGWIIDSNQRIGTMIGLENRLVLRQHVQSMDRKYHARCVIIPHGTVKYEGGCGNSHTRTTIDIQNSSSVTYHRYFLDNILQTLVGSFSLTSRLYQIYLHAVTSFCLEDPHTGLTGTETALDSLGASSMFSFQRLSETEINLMKNLASLTPTREPYPKHLRVMQSVTWKDLPPTAQHGDFHRLVARILKYWSKIRLFYPRDTSDLPGLKTDETFLERARARNMVWYPMDLDNRPSQTPGDVPYQSRIDANDHSQSDRVCHIAGLVYNWSEDLQPCSRLWQDLELWDDIPGPSQEFRLTYNHKHHTTPLGNIWLSLVKHLMSSSKAKTYSIMFILGSLAFQEEVPLQHLETLIAFATLPALRITLPRLPSFPGYNIRQGIVIVRATIHQVISDCAVAFESSHEASLQSHLGETKVEAQRRTYRLYETNLATQVKTTVDHLMSLWPRESIACPSTGDLLRITNSALVQLNALYGSWYRNMKLNEYIEFIQSTLNRKSAKISGARITCAPYIMAPDVLDQVLLESTPARINLVQLLQLRSPSNIPYQPPSLKNAQKNPTVTLTSQKIREDNLSVLISEFERSSEKFKRKYGEGMRCSWEAYQYHRRGIENIHIISYTTSELQQYHDNCTNYSILLFEKMKGKLFPSQGLSRACSESPLISGGLWPRITPRSLLRVLISNATPDPEQARVWREWKVEIALYGLAIIESQRAKRLLQCALANDISGFHKELQNVGCIGWKSMDYPEWLLFQIENDLLIRPIQAEISARMISPSDGRNTVMQLNMGEGKSSVIVPIIAATLADGDKLVRVLVLKPLASQMFQVLAKKLGGLLNRRIYYLPFSRAIEMPNVSVAATIESLYQECMDVGGILLAQPEHLLSFKLMGIGHIGDGKESNQITTKLLATYAWLEKRARDILDESDEILSVRYQLLYTIGTQKHYDGAPERWIVVQQVLGRIKKHTDWLKQKFPNGLDIDYLSEFANRTKDFPLIRIHDGDDNIEQELTSLITSDISKGLLTAISFQYFPRNIRELAVNYISRKDISIEDETTLERYFTKSNEMCVLRILRGLITYQILFFAFRQKRYRVDYGLSLARSLLAVPYRAKDSPSPRAEFGHPDVAIVLTCLSYYYCGLTSTQLETCIENLYKYDNSELEYSNWVANDPSVPLTLQHLSGLNLQDKEQFDTEIFPRFKYNKDVIDFYLSTTVFPREAREFPHKLSTSGWDIAETRTYPTSGFSGTNDNQYILPTTIRQNDSDEQLHTNAKVLTYLVNSEKQLYQCLQSPGGRLLTSELLRQLIDCNIQVLLDVGAQILQYDNHGLVKLWLEQTRTQGVETYGEETLGLGLKEQRWLAAVYFDEHDELMVLTHDGTIERFETSPFSTRMEVCLVYLDEAHTRGTDLKLPTDSVAAVTLGPKLVKDRLVQACMRMRKLGQGQSVAFFAPPEVDRQIREYRQTYQQESPISNLDIVRWAIHQACLQTKQDTALWASQGINYQWRQNSWLKLRQGSNFDSQNFKVMVQEQESQYLQELYGVSSKIDSFLSLAENIPSDYPSTLKNALCKIRHACSEFEISTLDGARVQEEQERELAHEIHREAERENPPRRDPLTHRLHSGIELIIKTGKFPHSSSSHMPAFDLFKKASFRGLLDRNAWVQGCSSLHVSADYTKTVRDQNDDMDLYFRPPSFLLSSTHSPDLLLISPFEANEVFPILLKSKGKARLHVYSPRTTRSMQSLEGLSYCAFPTMEDKDHFFTCQSTLIQHLNLFAGQLYLRDYDTYCSLCHNILGVSIQQTPKNLAQFISIEIDGFVSDPASRQALGILVNIPFQHSPLPLLKAALTIWRKGQGYGGTHLGKLLNARMLEMADFGVDDMDT